MFGSNVGFGGGYTDPSNPNFDHGFCVQNRKRNANLTAGAQASRFANPALSAIASDWRISGILGARSSAPLNVVTGLDNAFVEAVLVRWEPQP